MILEQLALSGFRNYEKTDLDFTKGVNVFLGENAQGKTNLIESIYFLGLARSHRTAKDKELIGWDQDFANVSGLVRTEYNNYPLEISLSKQGKKAKMNHLEQPKLSHYIGNLNIILFAPEDLEIVKGPPAIRRRFIDTELGQMSPLYLHHLVEFQRILKQRNHYLKQSNQPKQFDSIFFDILTEQLAEEASHVIYERNQFAKELEKLAQVIQSDISLGKEDLTIEYITSISKEALSQKKSIYSELMDLFDKNREKELRRQTSLVGPHRDELAFYVNGRNVQSFGSQGQQRTTALSVKLAEIDLMKQMTSEYPVLLLDDVLSELDDNRQTHLLKAIEDKAQVFLTTTSLDGVKIELLQDPKIFHVSNGQIEIDSDYQGNEEESQEINQDNQYDDENLDNEVKESDV